MREESEKELILTRNRLKIRLIYKVISFQMLWLSVGVTLNIFVSYKYKLNNLEQSLYLNTENSFIKL